MAEKKSSDEGFDLARFQQLVELMEKHDLREIRLQKGSEKWFLRRGPQEVLQAVPMSAAPSMHMPAPVATASAPAAAATATPAAAADDGLKVIKSPMVGTF
jgi:acetyl-CoA carboxylase biotin carboxyl carrier protein